MNPPRIAAINASAPIAACVSLTPSSRAIDWKDELTGTALLVVARVQGCGVGAGELAQLLLGDKCLLAGSMDL